jgi:hypothetical protein
MRPSLLIRARGALHGSGGIFINYRGEDTHSYAMLLYRELTRCLGPEMVFLDTVSIPAGADYVQQLTDRVRSARVVLAVIGARWLTAATPTAGAASTTPPTGSGGNWSRPSPPAYR